jgi:hypothetical protein
VGELVEAGGEAPAIFDAAEEVLDLVPLSVDALETEIWGQSGIIRSMTTDRLSTSG